MAASNRRLLDTAIALHRQGRYGEALDSLAAGVQSAFASPDLLNVAAACATALGRIEDAVRYCEQALRIDPVFLPACNNLGILLQKTGRHAEAEAVFRRALSHRPDHAEAYYNLGLLCQESERLDEAYAFYTEAMRLRPTHAATHNNLGAIYKAWMRPQEAERCFHQALTIDPAYAEARHNLGLLLQEMQPVDMDSFHHRGNLLQQMGKLDEAQACYRRALALDPGNADLHNNLGVLLTRQKRIAEAEQAYQRALALRPAYPAALHNLALLFLQSARFDAAEEALMQLLHLQPGHAEGWASLANLLQRTQRLPEAEDAYARALAMRPDHAAAWNDFGTLLQQMRRFTEAESAYRRAIAISPAYPEPQWNLGFLLLYLGRLEEGWPLMEARYDKALARPIAAAPDLPFPQWTGQDLRGKSILVVDEQGFGDAIQFVRYLPRLKQAGAARVTLVCKPALVPLLRHAPGADCVIAQDDAGQREGHDYWVLMLSLPMRFRTALATIPAQFPYLTADPARMRHWRDRLPARGARVGLVWKGFGGHVNDAHRSLPGLSCLGPLRSVEDVAFVSLQRGMDDEQAQPGDADFPLLDLGPDIADFADTAAIVAQLDLVICVDTAVAHMAGALGKPCWVMLPYTFPDWRWMEGRVDSPWYPDTLTLYRQPAPGAWPALAHTIAADLARWVRSR